MDIWVLVVILLVVSVVLFVASFYLKDEKKVDELIDDLQIQHAQEIYQLKARLTEVENELKQPTSLIYGDLQDKSSVEALEEVEIENVSDLTKEEVIRLYSQGFTMEEISQDVAVHPSTVQQIVDDYIENR